MQDGTRKHAFRIELLPQWIKRSYYELSSLKLFADDGIAKAMAVVSMEALPFATDIAEELQYHVLTALFYKFFTSLESITDVDRNAAVIKATQADGHYGLEMGQFVGCEKSTEALRVVNVLKRYADLPVAEVSWAYNMVKTSSSAPTTAHLCFICHRMFNLSLNHHLLSLFVCLLLPRARRTHTPCHPRTIQHHSLVLPIETKQHVRNDVFYQQLTLFNATRASYEAARDQSLDHEAAVQSAEAWTSLHQRAVKYLSEMGADAEVSLKFGFYGNALSNLAKDIKTKVVDFTSRCGKSDLDKDPGIFDPILPSTRGCFKALVALDKQVAPKWQEYVKRAELGTVPPEDVAKSCREVSSIHAMLCETLEPIINFVANNGAPGTSTEVIFFVLFIVADPFESSCLLSVRLVDDTDGGEGDVTYVSDL